MCALTPRDVVSGAKMKFYVGQSARMRSWRESEHPDFRAVVEPCRADPFGIFAANFWR